MPKAKQLWRAKARKGHRYVKIIQVRGKGSYCVVREVNKEGKAVYGWLRGVKRDLQFHIQLSKGNMPPGYELWKEKR